MEELKETPIYSFNHNTLEEVRQGLNLSQNDISVMLDSFEQWIVKQNHFTCKKFDRHYLETCIITAKGSLERAKKTLDKLCTLKTLLPNFFSKSDIKNELMDLSGFMIQATMPKLLKNNYRLYIVKIVSSEFNSEMLMDFERFNILMSEYSKTHDYSCGFTCVIDCTDLNVINFVTNVNIIDLRNGMSVLMEGYGFRINAIYLLSPSKTIDVFVTLLKQVLSAKISGRIHVVRNFEGLHEHVPKEVLPKDYGGSEKTLKEVQDVWINELSAKENVAIFKKMLNAKTDEKSRLTANYNDQILGMPGSFRSLTVD